MKVGRLGLENALFGAYVLAVCLPDLTTLGTASLPNTVPELTINTTIIEVKPDINSLILFLLLLAL
jgi:hypothetical protein